MTAPASPKVAAVPERPRVVVPDQIGPLHPVLREAWPAIPQTAERLETDPRRSVGGLPALVGVTKASLDRALRIMNAVLFAVEAAGSDAKARSRGKANAAQYREPAKHSTTWPGGWR